ncbi:MAG: succinate dehydrogenase cytochrome b subunit [Candidatus Omnitrophica bacterium]|nr:succinate dehydrogenase cytochrome b subunit [Candidatus Omnitrophota bacterium]
MCFSDKFKSSIGRKAVVAVTGLVLLGYVIVHMLGNWQIFLGPDALNDYARHLHDWPLLLWPARAVLLTAFVIHIVLSLQLANENRKARPIPYVQKKSVQASRASLTMVITGLLLLFFVIYHLLHFTFGVTNPDLFHLQDDMGRIDVYSMVVRSYQNIWISGFYIIAMFFLAIHLCHGASSFLQSLGLLPSEEARKRAGRAGIALAIFIFVGNSAVPVAILLGFIHGV